MYASMKHNPTGVQTDVVGVATVGLFVLYETTLSLPAANSTVDTYSVTLSGSGFYDTTSAAYEACMSGDGCTCTCTSDAICDGMSGRLTSRVDNNNIVISTLDLTGCTGALTAKVFYKGSLTSYNDWSLNSIGTILLLTDTLTSQSLIQGTSSTITMTGSGFIYTNTSAYNVSTYCNGVVSSTSQLATTSSVQSETQIVLQSDISDCTEGVYVVLNYDDGVLSFTFPVSSDSTGVGTTVQIIDTTTTQSLVQTNWSVTILGQGFYESSNQIWEAIFSGSECTKIDSTISTATGILTITSETQLVASVDLSDCKGTISVGLKTNNTGTLATATLASTVAIGQMIEILSNDDFFDATQPLEATNNVQLTVFGSGFGSSNLDDYSVTMFGMDCENGGSKISLSNVTYYDYFVRQNMSDSSNIGANALLIGMANLAGCTENVYASIDFQSSGLPGVNVSIGEIVRISDTKTLRGYFVSNSVQILIDGIGFVSENSSDYVFNITHGSTSVIINGSELSSFTRTQDSSSAKKATLTLTGIDISNFTVNTCSYSASEDTCIDEVLTAKVQYQTYGWNENEVSVGRLVHLATTEFAVEAASGQIITFRGSGFGSELPEVDRVRVILKCSQDGDTAECLNTMEGVDLTSKSTCTDSSVLCDADPGVWFLNADITSIDHDLDLGKIDNVNLATCLDPTGVSTGVHAQIIADTNNDAQYVSVKASCVSIGSMTSVYDTSTFFGLASKTGQNVTILGTGFGSNVEIAEKKNIVKVSGTNCPDTTSNSSYLEIVYVSSSELVLSGVDLTGCSKDINVSIYQRQEDFETNVSIISTAADYIASLSSVVNGSIPNDLKLVVENKIVATIVQITDTYKSLQPLGMSFVLVFVCSVSLSLSLSFFHTHTHTHK